MRYAAVKKLHLGDNKVHAPLNLLIQTFSLLCGMEALGVGIFIRNERKLKHFTKKEK